ncbi:MAG: hypothetical protein K0S65_3793 [Labilithrix sp.]|nr:hypothetical protein [Labilithrix sp.]
MALKIASPAFSTNGDIPPDYTADGKDEAPPLEVSGIPSAAKSLALIVEDPDAPSAEPFTHWVVWDIPATVQQIGPTIPKGRHRYVFKLYALDTTLAEHGALTKADLQRRLEGHVLDEAELVGTYARAA